MKIKNYIDPWLFQKLDSKTTPSVGQYISLLEKYCVYQHNIKIGRHFFGEGTFQVMYHCFLSTDSLCSRWKD